MKQLTLEQLSEIVEGEEVGARRIVIRRLESVSAAESCEVLYVDKSVKDIPKILAGLGPGVLTVGEGDSFRRDGGMVAFVIENRRVRFDVNQTAVEKSALKMSSRMLNVARSVEK